MKDTDIYEGWGMRCEHCGTENRDDAKFCRSCGRPLGADGGKKPRRLRSALIVLPILAIVGLAVFALGRGGGGARRVDGDGNYVFSETVVEEIDAASSPDVPIVSEVAEGLEDRGFEGLSLTSGYDMDGAMLEDEELDPSSGDRHPLYNAFYVTPDGRAWVVYVCNGAYMANPLFMYDPSEVPYLLVEDDYVTSYSSNENKFIRTVPDESEVVMKRVARIDAETLDALDEEGVESL